MKSRVPVLIAAALVAPAALADTIIDLPGLPTTGSVISPTQYNAVSFSLTEEFTDVAIEASLTAAAANTTGTAYLTTAIGAGATAGDVVASGQFTFVQAGGIDLGFVEVFNGLTLPADDYFLIFGAPFSVGASGSIEINAVDSYTTHPSASVGNMLFTTSARNEAFPPASTWSTSGLGNRYFRVTGVPEPGSLSLLALAGLAGLRRRS